MNIFPSFDSDLVSYLSFKNELQENAGLENDFVTESEIMLFPNFDIDLDVYYRLKKEMGDEQISVATNNIVMSSKLDEEIDYKRIRKVENALNDYSKGKFLIVSDNEERENEGDLIISAECCTAEDINFMITYGKGLVCVAITPEIANKFSLQPMVLNNQDSMGTAFTVSIDATPKYGVTTGISAADRAKTISILIDENSSTDCIQSPGHMFPLIAKDGGVMKRKGHTEAAVTLSKLVHHKEAGVIVEIIKPDGEMGRRDYLDELALEFDIKHITIEDLVYYCHSSNNTHNKKKAQKFIIAC